MDSTPDGCNYRHFFVIYDISRHGPIDGSNSCAFTFQPNASYLSWKNAAIRRAPSGSEETLSILTRCSRSFIYWSIEKLIVGSFLPFFSSSIFIIIPYGSLAYITIQTASNVITKSNCGKTKVNVSYYYRNIGKMEGILCY